MGTRRNFLFWCRSYRAVSTPVVLPLRHASIFSAGVPLFLVLILALCSPCVFADSAKKAEHLTASHLKQDAQKEKEKEKGKGKGRPEAKAELEGEGTELKPFLIRSASDLQKIEKLQKGDEIRHFKLVADIDLKGMKFSPIQNFFGTLDGAGHKISGFKYDDDSVECGPGTENHSGFFRRIRKAAVVKNLTLEKIDVKSYGFCFAGGIAGKNEGTIENCHVSGNVTAGQDSAGLVVGFNSGKITKVAVSGRVKTGLRISHSAGGIAGTNEGSISQADVTKTVVEGGVAGGIVGTNKKGVIENSSVSATVTGTDRLGGAAGFSSGTIEQCIFSGSLEPVRSKDRPYSAQFPVSIGGIAGVSSGKIGHSFADASFKIDKDKFNKKEMPYSQGRLLGVNWKPGEISVCLSTGDSTIPPIGTSERGSSNEFCWSFETFNLTDGRLAKGGLDSRIWTFAKGEKPKLKWLK